MSDDFTSNDCGALTIAQIGFTGSDADRERLLMMDIWLERHDPSFADRLRVARASAATTDELFDLNCTPPRDFLLEQIRADVVVLHNLWGFPEFGRGTGTTSCSPIHSDDEWNRQLAATGARHIFVFGRDFDPEPEGYRRLDDPSGHGLTVWTRAQTRPGHPITLRDLAEARLARLSELQANETLDLSHVAAVESEQYAAIAKMPNLRHLLLSGVAAQDDDIAALLSSGCHRLRSLYLDDTSVGAGSLRSLSFCPELTLLSLNDTAVGGTGLEHLRYLTRLETLSLVNSNVGSEDLESLAALRSLRMLALTGSRLSRREVDLLAYALPECSIDIADEAAT